MKTTERDRLIKPSRQISRIYPVPLTLTWRQFHFVNYTIGGISFVFGSLYMAYFMENFTASAAIFTVGSANFLAADTLEWWTNNRVGCFYFDYYSDEYEEVEGKHYGRKDTVWGVAKRMEKGVNFFTNLIGTLGYFVGSVLFFPQLGVTTAAIYIFIFSSLAIFVAQTWKVYRQGCTDPNNLRQRSFRLKNYTFDVYALGVDIFSGLGGLWYFIGSILLIPQIDTSDSISFEAAIIFIFGGIYYMLSGVFMYFRYFVSNIQWE